MLCLKQIIFCKYNVKVPTNLSEIIVISAKARRIKKTRILDVQSIFLIIARSTHDCNNATKTTADTFSSNELNDFAIYTLLTN